MRLLNSAIGLFFAFACVSFAVSNRDAVTISLWPFPFSVDLGLYSIVLACLLGGFVFGCFFAWVAAGKHRRRARKQQAQIRRLEAKIEGYSHQLEEPRSEVT